MSRRPHRSFRRSFRRDYVRSLSLPGYLVFTREVWVVLWQHKKLFGLLALVYSVLSAVLVGFASQDTFTQMQSVINESGKTLFSGTWGEIGKSGILLLSGITGSFMPQLTDTQQVYNGFLVLMTWLTTVWLLRAIAAGNTPRLRDGMYHAGAPIVSTILVALGILLQALPLAIAIIIFTITSSTVSGIAAMVFWLAGILLVVLSLYWITSSFLALVIVTLPGMYPWRAIRTAGDLVVGRRLRILLRLLWLIGTVALAWIVIMLPVMLLDNWLVATWPVVASIPIVPVVMLLVTSAASIWCSSYVYMLYRKVVDDDAKPA